MLSLRRWSITSLCLHRHHPLWLKQTLDWFEHIIFSLLSPNKINRLIILVISDAPPPALLDDHSYQHIIITLTNICSIQRMVSHWLVFRKVNIDSIWEINRLKEIPISCKSAICLFVFLQFIHRLTGEQESIWTTQCYNLSRVLLVMFLHCMWLLSLCFFSRLDLWLCRFLLLSSVCVLLSAFVYYFTETVSITDIINIPIDRGMLCF